MRIRFKLLWPEISVRGCISVAFLLLTAPVFAIERPVIRSLWVDPQTDSITLTWDLVSEEIDFYMVAERDEGGGFSRTIDTVAHTVNYYTFLEEEKGGKEYTVIASKGGSSSTGSVWHNVILVENTNLNACEFTASFSWHAYLGWEDDGGVAVYRLYDFLHDSLWAQTDDLSVTLTALEPNTNYRFYVVAVRDDGVLSSSYAVDVFSAGDEVPSYIRAAASVESGKVRLYGEIDESSAIRRFRLDRTQGSMQTNTRQFTVDESSFHYDDLSSSPDLYTYSYVLHALNECENSLASSAGISPIFLKLHQGEDVVRLNWSAYHSDGEGFLYQVYRVENENQLEMIAEDLDALSYQDDITALQYREEEPLEARICYYIQTYDQKMNINSRSNLACVELKPKVAIPNAFSPDGDGVNDVFLPIFDFVPREYRLIIYNSWGELIFESQSPEMGWDGTSGGVTLGEGSYSFSLYMVTFQGNTLYYRGGVSILK